MLNSAQALRLLLLGVIAAFLWMIRPFADALLIAAVVSILAWPSYSALVKRLHQRRTLATFLTVTALTLGILLPLTGVFFFVGRELVLLINQVVATIQSGSWNTTLDQLGQNRWVLWGANYAGGSEALISATRDAGQSIVLNVASTVTQSVPNLLSITAFAIIKVTIFYLSLTTLLHRGDELATWALRVSPLEPKHTTELFAVFSQFARNVVLAGIVAGATQGAVATLGYWIAGVDRPLLFGVLTGILAYIPMVGTAMAWVPLSLLLVARGEVGVALFVVLWSIFLTGTVDNFIKPIIVRGHSNVPTALVFIGVFGGLAWFGVIGLLVGPVLVAMLLALFQIYESNLLQGPRPS